MSNNDIPEALTVSRPAHIHLSTLTFNILKFCCSSAAGIIEIHIPRIEFESTMDAANPRIVATIPRYKQTFLPTCGESLIRPISADPTRERKDLVEVMVP